MGTRGIMGNRDLLAGIKVPRAKSRVDLGKDEEAGELKTKSHERQHRNPSAGSRLSDRL